MGERILSIPNPQSPILDPHPDPHPDPDPDPHPDRIRPDEGLWIAMGVAIGMGIQEGLRITD